MPEADWARPARRAAACIEESMADCPRARGRGRGGLHRLLFVWRSPLPVSRCSSLGPLALQSAPLGSLAREPPPAPSPSSPGQPRRTDQLHPSRCDPSAHLPKHRCKLSVPATSQPPSQLPSALTPAPMAMSSQPGRCFLDLGDLAGLSVCPCRIPTSRPSRKSR